MDWEYGTEDAAPMPPQQPAKAPYIRILQPRGEMVCEMTSCVRRAEGVFLHFNGRGSLCTGEVTDTSMCSGCRMNWPKFWYAAIVGRDAIDGERCVLMVPRASWVQWMRDHESVESLAGLRLTLQRIQPKNPSSPCRLAIRNIFVAPQRKPKTISAEEAIEIIRTAYNRFVLQP